MLYIYTAIFTPIEDGTGYYAKVPDLPGCISTGSDLADAISQITDALNAWLVVAEDEELDIPAATPQNEISKESSAVCSLITADTIDYRARTDTHSVRKNVSLPCWMVNLADKRGINCSQLLQDSLRAILDTPSLSRSR